MMDALDCDVDVANYPRVMYEAEREKELEPDDQHDDVYPQESNQAPRQGNQQMMRRET